MCLVIKGLGEYSRYVGSFGNLLTPILVTQWSNVGSMDELLSESWKTGTKKDKANGDKTKQNRTNQGKARGVRQGDVT